MAKRASLACVHQSILKSDPKHSTNIHTMHAVFGLFHFLLAYSPTRLPRLARCYTRTSSAVAQRHPAAAAGLPSWVPADAVEAIGEREARAACSSMQTVALDTEAGPVVTTYLRTAVSPTPDKPPLLLVHGFDISSLEWRRLLPELEARGIEAYAPCVAGWGFTDTSGMASIAPLAKRAQLLAFWEEVLGGRPATWVGASLGGSMVVDAFGARPDAVASAILLDPACFTPAPPAVPRPVASLLVRAILAAPPFRVLIAKSAYFVKEAQTEDAIRVGSLHLPRAKWADDSSEWLSGGGYDLTTLAVGALATVPTLALFGRHDEVIPPASAVPQLVAALPAATFRWVERSGHTPHLERPRETADAIAAFVGGAAVGGDGDVSRLVRDAARGDGLRGAATAAAEKALGAASAALVLVQNSVKASDSSATPSVGLGAKTWSLGKALDAANAALDTPILDTNVRGGPLEPLKRWMRAEPELAQIAASIVAIAFFICTAKLGAVLLGI